MQSSGYLATVVLCVASLARLQSNLSELCLLADAFGLLDDAKPQRWQRVDGRQDVKSSSPGNLASWPRGSQILAALLPMFLSLARFIAMITAAYFTCQYFFRYGPSSLHRSLDQLGKHRFVKTAFGESFDGSWWDALCLSGPYAVLVAVFARDLLCYSAPTAQKRSRQLSQMVYDRYFGVEGTYYMFKVALLQLLTILLQAFGKLHLLGGIALFAEQQRLPVAESLKAGNWINMQQTLNAYLNDLKCLIRWLSPEGNILVVLGAAILQQPLPQHALHVPGEYAVSLHLCDAGCFL